jgi:hypothetical protein
MVVQACSSSTRRAQVEGSQVQGQPGWHETPSQKKKKRLNKVFHKAKLIPINYCVLSNCVVIHRSFMKFLLIGLGFKNILFVS